MLMTVAKQMQHCCSHLTTKEMLDDVEDDVWWKQEKMRDSPSFSLGGNQTSFNIIQHHATWWLSECNMLDDVVSVWSAFLDRRIVFPELSISKMLAYIIVN